MHFLFSFLIFLSSNVFALEGFKTLKDPTPQFIADAFEAVYFLDLAEANSSSTDLGTAFLIHAEVGVTSTQLYFVTAGHLFEDDCTRPGVCANLYLHKNPTLNFASGGNGYTFQASVPALRNIEILKVSQNPDLALLRATIPNGQINDPKVLIVSKSCQFNAGEKFYTIGFPAVYSRTAMNAIPISKPNTVVKRWSEGVYVETAVFMVKPSSAKHELIATTVDTLLGSSGGPYLNEKGEVVGVSSASSGDLDDKFKYPGDETPGHLHWASEAVSCKFLGPFLNDLKGL